VSCVKPLDPLDIEALASGSQAPSGAAARAHVEVCEDCERQIADLQALESLLDSGRDAIMVPPGFFPKIQRLRAFSPAERRRLSLWVAPAALLSALVAGSAGVISAGGSFLPAAGAEVAAAWDWPAAIARALPAAAAGASDLIAAQRGAAAAAVLLLLPFGLAASRLIAHRQKAR